MAFVLALPDGEARISHAPNGYLSEFARGKGAPVGACLPGLLHLRVPVCRERILRSS